MMLQTTLQVLDLGLSPTMNREMARYSVEPAKAPEARDLVRTLEFGYWLIGIVAGAAIIGASSWFATDWIKASTIPVQSVKESVMLMGILAVLQWPLSFYQGGLMGLRRQDIFNAFKIAAITLSNGGAILILWLVSATINAFLIWQVVVSGAQVAFTAIFLWKSLPYSERVGRFDLVLIRRIWRFAAGMSGIAATGLVLTQIDKVLVSKLLSLKIFGYYTLAWSVANGLLVISGAVFNVVFPRMSAQIAAGDATGVRLSYHRGSQLMAVLVLPLAAVISLFSFEILRGWTRSTETAMFAAPILAVLAVGSALNALLYIPYALQLACGWTNLSLVAGLLTISVVVPTIIPVTQHFGPKGAAAVWAALNVANIIVVVPIMHLRALPGEAWGYFRDIGFPFLAVMGTATLGRLVFVNLASSIQTIAAVSTVWLGAVVVAILSAPHVRSWAFQSINRTPAAVQQVGE